MGSPISLAESRTGLDSREMANTDYKYTIRFLIKHPYLSVSEISQSFEGLVATRSVNVGESYRAGRNAKISIWEIEFFKSPLAADEFPLELKFNNLIDALSPFTNAVHNLTREGAATCEITIFSRSPCSVCLFSAESIIRLGKTGIDLVLTFYERDNPVERLGQ